MSAWPLVPLGEVFEIARGGSPRPIDAYLTEEEDGVNWISIADASDSSKYIERTKRRIRPEGVSRSRIVRPGDFLLTNSMSFGRPYIMRTTGCIHDGWLVLGKKRKDIDHDFFFRLLGSHTVYTAFSRLAAGATVKNLNIELVRSVEVPVPPIDEQRRIAAILDQADALRAKRREALAQLGYLTQSIFIDMFGDPTSNHKAWPDAGLGDAVALMQYGPRFYDEAYSADGIRIARITDLSDSGDLDFDSMPKMSVTDEVLAQFALRPGDVIFARTGATVGKVALYREGNPPCIPGAYFIRMKFKPTLLPDYAFALLRCNSVRAMVAAQSRQAAQQNFSGPGLRRLPLPVPPIDLQESFASRVQIIRSIEATHRAALTELDALFASLQHRAFTGQLS